MDLSKEILSVDRKKYGDRYNDHILEIYKKYLDMADKISDRRQNANNYFLAINTAIIGFIGYAKSVSTQAFNLLNNQYWLINIVGIILCYIWYRIVKSYKHLNSGKFKVVHQLEKMLPVRPFDAEWTAVGRGKDRKKYLPFTHLETKVPIVFLFLHAAIIAVCIFIPNK